MKKVLLATTALIASAGFAAAEVSLSGSAELGVFDPGEGDGQDLQFHTDIDVTFTMTAETDTGLTFGADIDLDESDTDASIDGVAINRSGDDVGGNADVDNDGIVTADELNAFLDSGLTGDIEVGGSPAFDNDTQGGEVIFIQGPFGLLTMGDTDGAFDWALQEAIIGSAINDDHEHAGYNGNGGLDGTYDGQIARYEYTAGDFAVAVSGEMDDNGFGDPVLGIGARYSTSFGSFRGNPIGIGFGVGYQTINQVSVDFFDDDDDTDDDAADIYGVSADFDLGGGLQAIVNYSDGDNSAGATEHLGVAVGYTVDALTVAANYGRFDVGDDDNDEIDNDKDGYGFIVNYDLGGGAEAQFGYGFSDNADTVDADGGVTDDGEDSRYSLGIAISF